MSMERRSDPGLIEAVRIDLARFHAVWMDLVFPRQYDVEHTVLGKWTPDTTGELIAYRAWGALGAVVVGGLYPLVVLGFMIRFYSAKLDRTAASIGVLGVILLSVLVWGGLAAAAYASRISFQGFVAVAAAGGVATLSAVLAVVFSRVGGRFTTVFLAYPFGVTALFLPPVVAALYSPTLAEFIFPRSQSLSIWFLNNVLDVWGIADFLRTTFDLVGLAYVGMWFALAVPVGWILGILVTLANLVRPSGGDDEDDGDDGDD